MKRLAVVGVVAVVALSFFCSGAHAEGTTTKGTPFPDKVGGARFGITKDAFSEACLKATGSAATELAPSTRAATLACTKVFEQPASLPPVGAFAVEFCKVGGLCEARLIWHNVDLEAPKAILASLRSKYGNDAAMPDSNPLNDMAAACARGEKNARHTVVWIFGEPSTKPDVRVIAGALQFNAFCRTDNTVAIHVIYENKNGFTQRRAKDDANF